MKMKKLKLSQQYFVNMLIFLLVFLLVLISKANYIPEEYQEIYKWFYYPALLICGLTGFMKQEAVDESAEKVLNKVNNIIWNVVRLGLIVLGAIVGGPAIKDEIMNRDTICILIFSFLVLITFLKYILFLYYDRKGL